MEWSSCVNVGSADDLYTTGEWVPPLPDGTDTAGPIAAAAALIGVLAEGDQAIVTITVGAVRSGVDISVIPAAHIDAEAAATEAATAPTEEPPPEIASDRPLDTQTIEAADVADVAAVLGEEAPPA